MEGNKTRINVSKFIITVLSTVSIVTVGIVFFLQYKQRFEATVFSDYLFYAAMIFIAMGGFAAYGSVMSTRSFGHKYVSSVSSVDYDTRNRMDESLINSSVVFMIKMVVIGVIFIVESMAVHKLL